MNVSADLPSQDTANLNSTQSSGGFGPASPTIPTHPVAVILPVYRGVEMTRHCILAAMPNILAIPGARIIAINDASPDMGMQEMLDQFAAQWPDVFVTIQNEKNLGFVGSVNRGFAYFPQHDAVLLNSDVIVPREWLGRLIDEAYSRPDIGTVTPFSNNATICSFPNFLQENVQSFNLDVDSIDAVFRKGKLPCVEAPTGVGFCMYIRRACLDVIGNFNEEKFGRGYGEENDLCQRALKSGWLNIISPNIYAYHEGGVSFSSDKQALVDRAMRVIGDLHPNYLRDVQLFIKKDPLKSARITRYAQLLSALPIPKVLHISHAMGGGTAQHIDELAKYLGQRVAHIFLNTHGRDGAICISFGMVQHADKLLFALPSEYADLINLLKAIGVSAVHFHHTHGLDSIILRLPTDLGVAHLLTVHDFYWLGANPTLTDENWKYPGFYSDTQRNPLYPLPQGMTIANWQAQLRPLIESADCVIFPSNAAKTLFENVYHPSNAVVAPHIEAHLAINKPPSVFSKKDHYIIGALGEVSRQKGADVLDQVARQAKKMGLPFKFQLIGYAYRVLDAVEITGPYKSNELADLIQRHGLDIIYFPAQCPETYSYTLSYALDSGLPIIAPSIGAFPERLSGRQNVLLIDHLSPAIELLNQISMFIEKLSTGVLITAPIFEGDKSRHDFYACDYIPIVSRDLKIISSNETAPIESISAVVLRGLKKENFSLRVTLVHFLYRLYKHPSMAWIGRALPDSVRHKVVGTFGVGIVNDISKKFKGK